ncbi:MAG: EAL domain-containing protein [Candidatus Baltobacteraceae bacterium]
MEFYRRLFQDSPEAFVVYDDARRYVTVNQEAEALLGLPLSAVIGRTDAELETRFAQYFEPALASLNAKNRQATITYTAQIDGHLKIVDAVFRWMHDASKLAAIFGLLRVRCSGDAPVKPLSFGRELRVPQAALALHAEHTPLGVIVWDRDRRIANWSMGAELIFGWKAEEVIGKLRDDFPLIYEDDLPSVAVMEKELRAGGPGGKSMVNRNYTKNRRLLYCRWYNSHVTDGVSSTTLSLVEDITDYVRSTMRAEENEERLQALIRQQQERIRALYAVAASKGDSPQEQIMATLQMGRTAFDLDYAFVNSLDDRELTVQFALCEDAALVGVRFPIEQTLCRHAMQNGGVLAIENLATPAWSTDAALENANWLSYMCAPLVVAGKLFGSLVFASPAPRETRFSEGDRDLLHLMGALIAGALERKAAQDRVQVLTHCDVLTGLPNRVGLRERLTQAISSTAKPQKLAVLLLDLDRFKDINDTYGHQIGDLFLQRIAERLRYNVRSVDVIARISGDQFIVVLPNVENTRAVGEVAKKLLATIDAPIVIDGADLFATATIGVSIYPDDGADADSLLKFADIALHRAKDAGRNLYQFYTTTMNAQSGHRLALERRLREALRKNEFEVYYQPQVHLASGKILGVEALVRWRQGDGSLMLPSGFITLSEKTGLIVQLGEWVMQESCRQVRQWQRQLVPGLQLAINLSARQFYQPDLVERVRCILQETGFDPHSFEIEITESVAMQDAPQTVAVMRELKSAGVCISVDDFGTGYSSLSYLRLFPLDNLKIDRSFVCDIAIDEHDATIVQTVVAMAHALGLNVIAEGVETPDQLGFLRDCDCDYAQGNYFAPALSAREFEALVTNKVVA